MYTFNDKFEELIKLQITTTVKDMSFYTALSEDEYSVIDNYLSPYPKKVLELWCGLGRMSICLNKKNPGDTRYYLADSSKIMPEKYGWNPGNVWYNDLNLTKEFCDLNGLKNFKIIDLLKEDLSKLKNIDLVCSFMAVGFHYPIENYLTVLKQIMSKDGLMVFGVRKGVYENSEMLSNFYSNSFHDIPNNSKERILVLKWEKDNVQT